MKPVIPDPAYELMVSDTKCPMNSARLSKTTSETSATCGAKCKEHPDCVGFSFSPDHGNGMCMMCKSLEDLSTHKSFDFYKMK